MLRDGVSRVIAVALLVTTGCGRGGRGEERTIAPAGEIGISQSRPLPPAAAVDAAVPLVAEVPLTARQTPEISLDAQGRQIIGRMLALKSYTATLSEVGVLDGGVEVASQLRFRAPNEFRAEMTAPVTLAGVASNYTGDTLTLLYPQLRWAIRIHHLKLPDARELRSMLAQTYVYRNQQYRYQLGDAAQVASLPTFSLQHHAVDAKNLHRSGFHRVYQKYAFPLAGELRFAGNAQYRYAFRSVAFDVEISDESLALAIPAGFLTSEWNLHSPGVDLATAHAQAGFAFQLPEGTDLQLERERIVRMQGPVPAFMAVYTRNVATVLVSVVAAQGPLPAYGIPLMLGDVPARLLLTPMLSSIALVHQGTHYSIVGTIPFEELCKLAQRIVETAR